MKLNLQDFKPGAKIVSIFVNPSRTRDGLKYGTVLTILGWSEERKKWQTAPLNYISVDGKGYFAMSKREIPDFYFSANPVHIRAAEKQAARIKARLEKEEKLLQDKRSLLCSILETYTSEEGYSFDFIGSETLEKLTSFQIKKLKNWLTK